MDNKQEHNTSLVSITGVDNNQLRLLSNLYYEPFDPESVLSAVIALEHKPDVKWRTIHSIEQWCTAMDESKGGTLFVVSMEGELHIFKTNQWTVLDLGCPDGLNSIWAANDNQAFIVGLGGERIRVIDEKFEIIKEPKSVRLNAIHGSSESNVISVGDGGMASKFNGRNWNKIELPTNVNLLAVYCRSVNEIFIGGAGVLYRWDGSVWYEIDAEQLTVSSIAFFQGCFFVACGSKGIFVVKNDDLEPFKEITVYRLRKIGSILFGIGNKLVAQYDGKDWWGGDLDL
jgi:hypothetical protein